MRVQLCGAGKRVVTFQSVAKLGPVLPLFSELLKTKVGVSEAHVSFQSAFSSELNKKQRNNNLFCHIRGVLRLGVMIPE